MREDLNYSVFMRKRIQTAELRFAFYNNMITDEPQADLQYYRFPPPPLPPY